MLFKLGQSLRVSSAVPRRFFSSKQSFYDILGVPKGATQSEIKKAYAKLARELHPDKNTAADAKQKFSAINEAYQTLSDEKRRQVYDQTGMTGDEQKQYQSSGFDSSGGFDFGDFFRQQTGGFEGGNPFGGAFKDFEDIFMGKDGGRATMRGADVVMNLEIDFMDAINGFTKEVSFRVKDTCATCKGSKCKPGTSTSKCSHCAGKGTMNVRQGPMVFTMECGYCNGQGSTIKSPCSACKGSGQGYATRTETIELPKGINTGQNVRVTGKGNKGDNGGPAGDLVFKVTIKPDPYFRRQDFDIYVDQPLTISQAVLGCRVDVRTLTGKKTINVPPGTIHGSKQRMPGEGVTKLAPNQHQKGDQYVVFSVVIPNTLTPEQKAIFEQLKNLETKRAGSTTSQAADASSQQKTTSEAQDQPGKDNTQKEGFFKSFENLFHGQK
jgi:molecular chaperone DnaJ